MDKKLETMTTTGGNPVADNQNSITAGPRGPLLMEDYQLLEKLAHQNRERIPERTVHAKGTAAYGALTLVTLLLNHGADVDTDNGGGMTPLMFAAMFGRGKVVEQLTARGASREQRNRLGMSAGFVIRVSEWLARLFQKGRPKRAA